MVLGRDPNRPHDREHRPPLAAALDAAEREVHRRGGRTLPEPCRPEEIPELFHNGMPAHTQGCGSRQSRVALPYRDEEGTKREVTLCGICDSLVEVPRAKPGSAP